MQRARKTKGRTPKLFYFRKNVYNSFNVLTNKLVIPCIYASSNSRHSSVVGLRKSPAVFSVAGELFIGTNLVQIDCSEIEWSFPAVRGANKNNNDNISNNRSPKRENLLKFEQEILHKKSKRCTTQAMQIPIQSFSTSS